MAIGGPANSAIQEIEARVAQALFLARARP
jgi:hypothetical protein